jgi:hypothetical protein
MSNWIDTGFRAIVRPKRVMKFPSGTFDPKYTYSILRQEYEFGDP